MLAAPHAMHQYKGQQISKRTLDDLEGLIDDPTQLMISSHASSKAPTISEQGLDILSASQYPFTLNNRYNPGTTTSAFRGNANNRRVSASQFYGGIVYDDSNAQSSGEGSGTESAGYRSQMPPASISSSRFPDALISNATNGASAPKSARISAQSTQPSKRSSLAEPKRQNSVADEDESPEPRPRKRAKKAAVEIGSTGQDDGGKRQRGRPRLDTQDETAADRRRTQIRLAQRAYRNRKETTISGLKGKVSNLKATIEQMNNSFVALHDNLMDSGLINRQRTLFSQLKSVQAEFETLAQAAKIEDDEDDLDSPLIKEPTKKATPKDDAAPAVANGGSGSPDQTSQDSDIELLPPSNMNGIYGYEQAWQNGMSEDIMQFNVQIPEAQISLDDVVSLEKLQSKWSPAPEKPLPLPVNAASPFYTYSFQETTFARRLHRLALERAFRHLTNPAMDPSYIARTFRFTFCFSNRKRLLARFQSVLRRKAGEALENFNVPFYHIGGAGTHFPRRDSSGNKVFPPNLADPDTVMQKPQFEPARAAWALMETPRFEATTEEMLEKLGYGGLWFDSHDVEEYLKTKGIFLDGNSSFIEIDPRQLSFITTTPNSAGTINMFGNGGSPDTLSNPTGSSRTSSTHDSPLPRTPSPPGSNGRATIDYVPGHWMATQPPPPRVDNFFPSFDNDAAQEYFTAVEKDLRAQDQWSQVQAVQTRQVWPWGSEPFTDNTQDLMASYLDPLDGVDAALSTSADFSNQPANVMAATGRNTNASPLTQSGSQSNTRNNTASTSAEDSAKNMNNVLASLQQRGQNVTIDVEKFLARMVEGGACLGRAPGFRKELVDNAIALSLAEAF
ncbi:uncharacterized protein AB675_9527 [Cyphellophora attinorum]|uniref:BZIP domain-containing protein n=1 Tax=Cyphellophora attinorum TaxID=1664694 RepID=A0A0N0NPD6_9EURO|nr:uncharacterized protein AB675_9527 [Phialophora attinorum]KPI42419.1 hypothetical protein AB675_9527 [Phialophora attinorum]